METETLVTCPYDESHRILQRRLHTHVISCRKNHLNTSKVHCKFNSAHIYDRMEIDHHMATCPSSGHVRADEYVTDSDMPPAGSIPVVVNDDHVCKNDKEEENWDDENAQSYNPLHNLESRPVVYMPVGLSKANRLKFRAMERERHRKLQNEPCSTNAASTVENNTNFDLPLRPPRQAAKACSIQPLVNIPDIQKKQDGKEKEAALSKTNTARKPYCNDPNDQFCDQENDTLLKSHDISLNTSQQAYTDQVASNVKKTQELSVYEKNQSVDFNKNNTSRYTFNSSYDQTYEAANVKYSDHEQQKLNETLDNIQLKFQNNLSIASTYCDDNNKSEMERNKEKYADEYLDITDNTSSGALDSINSRMAMLQEYEQRITEEKEKLLKQKMNILKTAQPRTERSFGRGDITARLMERYSTGRGFTRAHREYESGIEKKPGTGLEISTRQESAIPKNHQNDDTDKFSDEYLNKSAEATEDNSVKRKIIKSNKVGK